MRRAPPHTRILPPGRVSVPPPGVGIANGLVRTRRYTWIRKVVFAFALEFHIFLHRINFFPANSV